MEGAKTLLGHLNQAGYEAFIVGGAVRDVLMHRKPHDIDIVTSARPDDVIQVMTDAGAKTSGLVGKSFGVVVVQFQGKSYEVATYRSETYGADSHRPESITYADSLEDDVKRRDFTVNGMAMDKEGRIIDLVGGQRDLKKKRLVTIGDPVERFREDALRLFRACRFVAKLDFLPDKALLEAMPKAFDRVSGLSLERVRQELDRMLLEPAVAKGLDVFVQSGLCSCQCQVNENGQLRQVDILPELAHLVDLPQEKQFHEFDGWYHTLAAVAHTPADLTLRWGALLHDVGKGMPGIRGCHNGRITDRGHDQLGAKMALEALLRLGYSQKFAQRVAWIVESHMRFHFFAQHDEANAKKWLRQEVHSGQYRSTAELQEAFSQLTQVCAADILACGKTYASTEGNDAFGRYMVDVAESMPVNSKDLHYDKRLIDLMGADAKVYMPYLLEQVVAGRMANEPEALLSSLKRKLERNQRVVGEKNEVR
ncbi:MAG: CCA tRNA nucleotidyltransferase [Veillonella sp.]|nr:CCA tRNA nucleotidyltransferase [Veillonella sp.]